MSPREVQRLLEEIERMKRDLAQAEGTLTSIKEQMQKEFKVNTSEASLKLLNELKDEKEVLEKKSEEKLNEAKVLLAKIGERT